MHLAISLSWQRRDEEVEAHFERAQWYVESRTLVMWEHADYLATRKRWNEAREKFEEVLRLDPEHAPATRDFARLLAAIGEAVQAEALFVRALELSDDRWSNHRYGQFLLWEGRYQEALPLLTRAVELGPDYRDAIGTWRRSWSTWREMTRAGRTTADARESRRARAFAPSTEIAS